MQKIYNTPINDKLSIFIKINFNYLVKHVVKSKKIKMYSFIDIFVYFLTRAWPWNYQGKRSLNQN